MKRRKLFPFRRASWDAWIAKQNRYGLFVVLVTFLASFPFGHFTFAQEEESELPPPPPPAAEVSLPDIAIPTPPSSASQKPRPDSPYLQKPRPGRFKSLGSLFDPNWEEDETISNEERAKIRKEDRDVEKGQQKSLKEILESKPSKKSDLASKSFDQPEPQSASGAGQARIQALGAAPQIATGHVHLMHHFWAPLGIGARAEGAVDFLRNANQATAGGQLRLQLGRYISLLGDGGFGLGNISRWSGFRGELGLFIPDLVAEDQDSRVTLKFGSHAGRLSSLNTNVAAFDYTELLFGTRIEQELPATWVLRFDLDIGIPSTSSGAPLSAMATTESRRDDAVHLAHAAFSRSFSGVEGGLIATRWLGGIGFQPGRDIRVLIDGGQVLSALDRTSNAAWWIVSPKIEAQLSSRTYLLIEGTFATVLAEPALSDSLPASFYSGRLGVRVQWW